MKKRQNPFKKTVLSCTNTAAPPESWCPRVRCLSSEMYFPLFAAFLRDRDLVPGSKSVVSNSATGCLCWPQLSRWPGKGPVLALWLFSQWAQIKILAILSRAGSGPWFITSIISIIWWMSAGAGDLATNVSYVSVVLVQEINLSSVSSVYGSKVMAYWLWRNYFLSSKDTVWARLCVTMKHE